MDRGSSRAGGRASALVVLLHGYGANGDDLIALGDGWRRCAARCGVRGAQCAADDPRHVRRPAVVSAHAARSQRISGAGWRPPGRRSTAFSTPSSRATASPRSRLVLVGFSQGTMMALHVGLAARRSPRRHRRLLGPARRAGAPRRDEGAPAGAAHPRRGGRPDPGRGAAPGAGGACRRRASRSNGTCAPASATASIRRRSGWPAISSPGRCAG